MSISSAIVLANARNILQNKIECFHDLEALRKSKPERQFGFIRPMAPKSMGASGDSQSGYRTENPSHDSILPHHSSGHVKIEGEHG